MPTDAELIAQWEAAHSGGGLANPSPSDDELNERWLSAKADKDRWTGATLGTAIQGLSLGFGDEGISFLTSLLSGRPYDEELTSYRQDLAQFSEDNPKTALALELAGGLGTGGIGAAKAGVFKAPSIARMAIQGAKQGGLYGGIGGFGAGEEGFLNRAISGTVGAGLGAAGGGLFGGGTGTVLKAAANPRVREPLQRLLMSETGAVGHNLGSKAVPKLSRAEEVLIKMSDDVSDDDLTRALSRMEGAVSQDVPLTVVEALDSPQAYTDARFFRNTRGGRNVAETFLEGRARGTGERVTGLLDAISPERSAYAGAQALREVAEETVEAAEKARSDISKPFYEALRSDALIDDPRLKGILKAGPIKKAISGLKRDFPLEYGKLPQNHITMLDEAKKALDDQISTALRGGERNRVRQLRGLKKSLVDVIEESGPMGRDQPLYKTAREAYSMASVLVNNLKGTDYGGAKKGILSDILAPDERDVMRGVDRLMRQSPEQLAEIASVLSGRDKGKFRAGVRAYYQNILEKNKVGLTDPKRQNIVDKLLGDPLSEKKLFAALGPEEAEKIMDSMRLESLITKGGQKTHAGSSTQSNFATQSDMMGLFADLVGKPRATIEQMLRSIGKGEDEKFTREVAEVLFDPVRGLEAFRRILPVRRDMNEFLKVANVIARGSERGSAAVGAMFGISGLGGVIGALTATEEEQKGELSSQPGAPPQAKSGAPKAKVPSLKGPESRDGLLQSVPSPQGQKIKSRQQLEPKKHTQKATSSNSTTPRRSLVERAIEEAEKKLLEGEARQVKERISMDTKPPRDFDSLVKAVIHQESGGKATAVSPKGARGLMQIMPATAKEIAQELGVKDYDLNDPATNRKFGEHYLKKMLKLFGGDKKLALAAYNAGPGKVTQWIKETGSSDWDEISRYLERKKKYLETVNYVPSILNRTKTIRT